MPENKLNFSQRRPFLFGLSLLAAAVVLIVGSMAAVRYFVFNGSTHFMGDKFGLVHVEGFIADSRQVNEWIAELREDDDVKGVVIRVNSPGGAVSPAQEMFMAVKRLARKKPVVVSMGAVAASGGYYLAAPAHRIVASPGTLTGSIGVKMELANLEGLMDKLGIQHESLTSGKLKNAGSPYQPLTPEDRSYLQALVMDMYGQFLKDVSESRGMEMDKLKAVADGRALTGRQALEAGLVDELGGLDEAFEALKELSRVTKDLPVIEGPKTEESLVRDLLFGLMQGVLDRLMDGYSAPLPQQRFQIPALRLE